MCTFKFGTVKIATARGRTNPARDLVAETLSKLCGANASAFLYQHIYYIRTVWMAVLYNMLVLTSVVARVIPLGWNCSAAAATLDRPSSVWHAFK